MPIPSLVVLPEGPSQLTSYITVQNEGVPQKIHVPSLKKLEKKALS